MLVLMSVVHCLKSVRIQSYSGPHFPAFGLNTNQNNSEHGHFSRSGAHDIDCDAFRNFIKSITHRYFSRFLNFTNSTKSRKASQLCSV